MKGRSALLSSPSTITEVQRDPLTHPHTDTHMPKPSPLPGVWGFHRDRRDKRTHDILSLGRDRAGPRRTKQRAKASLEIKPHPCSCHRTLSAGNPGARRVNPQGSAPTLTHPVHEYFRQRKQDPGPSPFPWVRGQIQAPPTPCLTGHNRRQEDQLWHQALRGQAQHRVPTRSLQPATTLGTDGRSRDRIRPRHPAPSHR